MALHVVDIKFEGTWGSGAKPDPFAPVGDELLATSPTPPVGALHPVLWMVKHWWRYSSVVCRTVLAGYALVVVIVYRVLNDIWWKQSGRPDLVDSLSRSGVH